MGGSGRLLGFHLFQDARGTAAGNGKLPLKLVQGGVAGASTASFAGGFAHVVGVRSNFE
jgi:hypothetical protein